MIKQCYILPKLSWTKEPEAVDCGIIKALLFLCRVMLVFYKELLYRSCLASTLFTLLYTNMIRSNILVHLWSWFLKETHRMQRRPQLPWFHSVMASSTVALFIVDTLSLVVDITCFYARSDSELPEMNLQ